MKSDTTTKGAKQSEESKARRKPGRKPMTPEEKAAATAARAAEKAKSDNLKLEVISQYQDSDIDMSMVAEAAKTEFHKTKKRTLVIEMKLYIKPGERMAYYVINGSFEGKVPF